MFSIQNGRVTSYTIANLLRDKRLRSGALIFLGIFVGVLIAYLISREAWFYIAALLVMAPFIILIGVYPFSGIILWLLLMPFVTILPNPALTYWAIYRILTPAVFILAALYRLLNVHEHPSARLGPPELAMGGVALFVLISILTNTESFSQSFFSYADQILLPFCMYMAIRLLSPRERELHQLQWIALFIVFSQGSIGLLSWFKPDVLPSIWRHLQGYRTTGSLVDADLFSAILTFCAVLLIQGAIHRKSRMVRILFFGASGMSAISVFLSLERAAWLGGVLVTIGLIILFRKVMFRLIIIGLILMAILGTGVLSSHVSLSINRFSDPGPIYDRIVVFDAMLHMIQIKPVLGWGYETLNQNIQQFYRQVGEAAITRGMTTSHNTYLTILTELGLVGFILYMFPLVWWFVLSLRIWSRMSKEGLCSRSLLAVFWLSILFMFTVNNFIDMRWFPIGLTLWWMLLGFIASMVYPYLKDRQTILTASNLSVQYK